MSIKYKKFIAALDALCKEHGVTLATSGYATITVHDRFTEPDDCSVWQDNIDDETEPDPIP